LVRWLEQLGTRIVRTTDGYGEPRLGAGAWLSWAERAEIARAAETAHDQPGYDK
jgi:DNA polymerase-3 subunit epsilon